MLLEDADEAGQQLPDPLTGLQVEVRGGLALAEAGEGVVDRSKVHTSAVLRWRMGLVF